MFRRVAFYFVLLFILLAACGTPPSQRTVPATQQAAAQFRPYTDQEAEEFVRRLEKLGPNQSGKVFGPPWEMLKQIGIDITRLPNLGQSIGNCINTYIFDLSNSYVLFVDDNSCFPGMRRMSITKR